MQCEQWARLANLQPSFGLPPPYLSSAIHKSAPRVSFTRGFSRPFPSGFVCIFTSTDSGSASCCRQLLLREPSSANVEFAVPRQCARECSHARPAHATPHCQTMWKRLGCDAGQSDEQCGLPSNKHPPKTYICENTNLWLTCPS
jgi:hypothetical protein